MLKKNDIIELEITGYTTDGYGVGHYDSMAIFVPFTAKGDVLSVRILKTKKTYAYGKIEEIKNKSEDRIPSDCEAFTKCGGCIFRHINYESEAKLKKERVEETLKRIGHLDVKVDEIIAAENPCRYRNKAQYPVGEKDGLKIGFFATHSHRIVECDDCKLQPDFFKEISDVIREWIVDNKISIYDEITHKGLLRHIYIRYGEVTNEIMVCLVINGHRLPHSDELINALEKFENIKSIVLNINTEKSNVILGKEIKVLSGRGYIEDVLCGLKFRLSPLSFYQVNRNQAEKLYAKAAEYADLKEDEILFDLYCGTGTIGLTMADKVKKLIGVEIVEAAIEDAKINAEVNGIENAEFYCADAAELAEELLKKNIKPDVIIVDPPRKGCSADLLDTIEKLSPKRIVYVSCDPATLARDCKELDERNYKIKKVTAVDMFPRTAHVETVVLLSQRRPDTHIDIKLDLSELDVTAAETKATYQEIKDYVFEKHGLKVSSLYISQVKAKCGIIERENYNKGEGKSRVPQCPKEKEAAIMDALRYFRMI